MRKRIVIIATGVILLVVIGVIIAACAMFFASSNTDIVDTPSDISQNVNIQKDSDSNTLILNGNDASTDNRGGGYIDSSGQNTENNGQNNQNDNNNGEGNSSVTTSNIVTDEVISSVSHGMSSTFTGDNYAIASLAEIPTYYQNSGNIAYLLASGKNMNSDVLCGEERYDFNIINVAPISIDGASSFYRVEYTCMCHPLVNPGGAEAGDLPDAQAHLVAKVRMNAQGKIVEWTEELA